MADLRLKEDEVDYVRAEWLRVCSTLSVPTDCAKKWWIYIHDCYQSDGRHYHTLAHIYSMLSGIEDVRERLQSHEAVCLAIFFHDIVYEPTEHNNEEKSAEVFLKFAKECLNNSAQVDSVRINDMIIMTKHHQTDVHRSSDPELFGSDDIHYLLDSDMAILGQSERAYKKYAAAVRQEYIHMEERQFCRGRKAVLENFLKTPKIYSTKYFYELYEDVARANLTAEILSLSN